MGMAEIEHRDRWSIAQARLGHAGLALAAAEPADAGPLIRQWLAALTLALDAPAGEAVAADPASLALFQMARRAACSNATVLIGGPTGAGKEMLARFVHRASARSARPFVAINCAALPEAMLEALLFGHERGAFTGAAASAPGLFRAADGGTLFLDEVGELPLGLQAKLLRAVQEREVMPLGATRPVPVDVRLVAASNRNLHAMVAAGQFREDLMWRLAVFPLELKPLAARPGDVVALAAALLLRHARAEQRAIAVPTEAALARLIAHEWPGNVRELDNLLQRAAILAPDGLIDKAELRFDHSATASPAAALQPHFHEDEHGMEGNGLGLIVAVKTREAEAIRSALAAAGGRRTLAAARLGISERTLRYKLAALAGRPRTAPRAGMAHAAACLQ